jgi:polysaccharide biosynthesis PFTS motif protein
MQLKLLVILFKMDWRDAYLARQISALPRASLFVEDTNPLKCTVTIASAQRLSLWLGLLKRNNKPIQMVCDSTQIFPNLMNFDSPHLVVAGIYMHLNADLYFVWDKQHAEDLEKCGVNIEKISIAGPQILSTNSGPKISKTDKLVIDYFDQPPSSQEKIIRLGNPAVYHSLKTTIQSFDLIYGALKKSLPDNSWRLRIKSKRYGPSNDAQYFKYIKAIISSDKRVELIEPQRSPASMHPQSDITLGLCFVSPVVSAKLYGQESAFIDPGGKMSPNGSDKRGINILKDEAGLSAWLLDTLADQLGGVSN